jgi:hypothetical protein
MFFSRCAVSMVIMNNNSNDQDKKGQKGGTAAQPMNPTTGAEDFIGDTTGLTGVTTGSAGKTSATPNDKQKDENKDHLPGGIMESTNQEDTGRRLSEELHNTEEYDKNTLRGMSDVKAAEAEDLATEEDTKLSDTNVDPVDPNASPYTVNKQNASGDDSPGTEDINTAQAPFTQPSNEGQQSVSGSETDPTADDDTQAAAHAAGTQLDEDSDQEHPQELNLGRDIDKAERDLRNK